MIGARRGLSLVELLVGIVLLGMVSAMVTRLVAVTTRGAVRVRERSTRSATLRSAALAITRDVQGLATRELRVVGDTLRYRARRGEGVACSIDGTGVALARTSYHGWRLPQPGRDSLAVLDRGTGTWIVAGISTVASGTCPDGSAAMMVAGATWTGSVPAPVRVLEWVEARAYQSSGTWWLGARSLRPADVIQPLAGPIAPRGVSFTQVALGGADTLLEVRVKVSATPGGGPMADSTLVRLPLTVDAAP